MAASGGKMSSVIAANSGKFVAAFCRNLPRADGPDFCLPNSEGDGV
jgi:hypothetical protein